jgi:hypothetical protein
MSANNRFDPRRKPEVQPVRIHDHFTYYNKVEEDGSKKGGVITSAYAGANIAGTVNSAQEQIEAGNSYTPIS